MSFDLQSQVPRSQAIFGYTKQAQRQCGLVVCKFATGVAQRYMHRVAECDRIIAFHVGTTTDTVIAAEKANAQIVNRILDGTVKMPADLEEAWVQELPPKLRDECARDLARRYGLAGAALPQASANVAGSVSLLATEFGETMGALAPLLADGTIDATDSPQLLREALKQGTDLMAAWLGLQQQILRALETPPS